jgi:hypothetical protein
MVDSQEKLLLVGDNPFHNISHLSQERARGRTDDPSDPKYAASLILTSMENGANGFTFSVSETTLSILRELDTHRVIDRLGLYPIVPYAFEYVRLATVLGGFPGLAKKFGADMVRLRNIKALGLGLKGVLATDAMSILKTYLTYEISRIKSSVDAKVRLESVLLHQLITDMALALDLDLVFKTYIDFLSSQNIMPGFNTGNFAFLVKKFAQWNVDFRKVIIAAPFNKVGFQMMPSLEECEKALSMISQPAVIALSVLAAGYISPKDAFEYVAKLPNIKGVAVGVSKEKHARETFRALKHFLDPINLTP